MNVSFEKKIIVGFSIALIILGLLGYFSYTNNKSFANRSHQISKTIKILYHLEQILNLSLDIETGQRGFALTGNEIFLAPYKNATRAIDDHVLHLKSLTNHPSQLKRVARLENLILQKQIYTNEVIDLRKKEGIESAVTVINSLKGNNMMNEIRNVIELMQIEKSKSLKIMEESSRANNNNFNFTFISLLVCIAIILILVYYTILYNLKALKNASAEIQDLYNNAPCGYHSLNAEGMIVHINNTELEWLGYKSEEVVDTLYFTDVITAECAKVMKQTFPVFKQEGKLKDIEFDLIRKNGTIFPVILNSTAIYDKNGKYIKSRSTIFDNTERKFSENKIKELNKDLETNISKLEAVNNELESFSYSVSHDLRAPLRAIAGYAQILQEDYEVKLDQEGKKAIATIVKNAQRMGQLIDDLLSFSQYGRTEIVKSNFTMNKLIESVLFELTKEVPDRKIEVNLHALEPCTVDATLMKQVWINLLSNAIKYTRPKEISTIEIGSYTTEEENVYYIKDNGVGFDMQYVSKLFGVFQRLHKTSEFEGTGVGLAIVQRIIKRHGGHVWAEASINQGASFYFSLPTNLN